MMTRDVVPGSPGLKRRKQNDGGRAGAAADAHRSDAQEQEPRGGRARAADVEWLWPWGAAALAVAVFAVYAPAIRGAFLWDDDEHFAANPVVADPRGIVAIWTTAKAMYYPLTLTTWWMVRRLFGLNPVVFHLLTLAFHGASAAMFWALLRRWKVPGAPLAAALFALHPIQTESVAWATELKNTQSCFLMLVSLFAFSRFDETGDSGDSGARKWTGWRWWTAAFAAFMGAILSKAAAGPLPALLVIAHWWRRDGSVRWRVILATLPFFLAAAAWSAWTIWEQKHHSGAQGAEWALSFADRLVVAGRTPWFYLGKVLWPHPLIFVYPRWTPDGASAVQWLPLCTLLVAFCALAWAAFPSRGSDVPSEAASPRQPRGAAVRGSFAAVAAYLVLLAPTAGFFNIYYMRFSFVADHFAYHATLPLFALAGAGVAAAIARLRGDARRFAWVFAVAVIAALAFLTNRQGRMYRNEVTLWRTTTERNPNAWIAWNNLGYEIERQGRAAEALPLFDKALALRPDYDEALNNRALALMDLGRTGDAAADLRRAIELRPRFPDSLNNLATALAELGKTDDAVSALRQAIDIAPSVADYHANLGALLARQARFTDAEKAFLEAQRLDPSNAQTAERLRVVQEALRAGPPAGAWR